MSVASELTRIKDAKNDLKTSINAKTDSEHQITNETIEDYAGFVDSITSGGGSSHDWSAIGYSGEPQSISDNYNYSLQIKNNWEVAIDLSSKFNNNNKIVYMPLIDTSITTNMYNMCNGCTNLTDIPLLDTSKVGNMRGMFAGCTNLKNIPILDTRSVTGSTGLYNTFASCPSFTDTTLDNILQMCINATSYTGTKTLYRTGFNSANYPASRIQALPHYQAFINAGWTIGY